MWFVSFLIVSIFRDIFFLEFFSIFLFFFVKRFHVLLICLFFFFFFVAVFFLSVVMVVRLVETCGETSGETKEICQNWWQDL